MAEPVMHTSARRLHPLTLVQRVIKSLPAMIVALLPLLLRSSDTGTWVTFGFLLVYGVVALPLILLHYLRFHYWITPREIVIHSGVLTRRKRNIPIHRIQNVVIERSLLPRLLGTAKVTVETAGSTAAEGVLEYVSLAEAQAIRQVVRAYQRRQAAAPPAAEEGAPAEAAPVAPPEAAAAEQPVLFTMSLRRVLLSGVFRFSLLYIALIFSALQYLMDLAGLTPDDLADWIVGDELQPYAEALRASPWLLGFAMVAVAALFGWLTGIAINLSKYYGFRLWLDGEKLHRRHGLLTVHEGTIPLKKVQTLILRSNPVMRRFGWYRLEVQTMGYDVEKEGYQVAMPFARKSEILGLAPHIRPFTLPEAFTPVSKVTIRRRFIRYSVVLLVVLLPLSYAWPAALWGLLGLPLLLYFAVLQYRNHGYALHRDVLYVQRGVLRHYVWVVPMDRFQVFYTTSTFFQRRLGLCSLVVDTAGAGSLSYPKIVDVVVETGAAFMQTLYEQFQARFTPVAQAGGV